MGLLPGFVWDREIPNRHGLKFRGFHWGYIFIGSWQFTRMPKPPEELTEEDVEPIGFAVGHSIDACQQANYDESVDANIPVMCTARGTYNLIRLAGDLRYNLKMRGYKIVRDKSAVP